MSSLLKANWDRRADGQAGRLPGGQTARRADGQAGTSKYRDSCASNNVQILDHSSSVKPFLNHKMSENLVPLFE